MTFTVYFGERTTHSVKVVLHRTKVGVCRSAGKSRNRGQQNTKDTVAYFDPNHDAIHGPIGELLLSAKDLSLDDIAHDCVHAAFRRADRLGLSLTNSELQEQVAHDTGMLTDAIAFFLREHKCRVRYEHAKKRVFGTEDLT